MKKLILIVPITLFMIGCSDTTNNETITPNTPELTYTYLRCEDKDESWKEDVWVEREHWANLVLKIHSDSQRVFQNGPDSVWREQRVLVWNTNEIMLSDSGYSGVTFDAITINRESLNATRGVDRSARRGKYWNYGCEIMSETESTDYEDTFAKTREELVRKSKEREEEQKKKNKI